MQVDTSLDDTPPPRSKVHAPLPQPKAAPPAPEPMASAPLTEEDPRVRAARRTAELLGHGSLDDGDSEKSQFDIDVSIIPDGWTYEWKRVSVLGKEDPSYQVKLQSQGWESVPAYRHRELMPKGYEGGSIDKDGQRLMERPAEITKMSVDREYRKARQQIGQKEQQINGPQPGQAPRDNKGRSLVSLNRSYGPPQIPD